MSERDMGHRVYQQLDAMNARLGRLEHLWATERKRIEAEAREQGARDERERLRTLNERKAYTVPMNAIKFDGDALRHTLWRYANALLSEATRPMPRPDAIAAALEQGDE